MDEFVVKADEAGTRADVFLSNRLPGFSRSLLASLFEHDVLINDIRRRPSFKLRQGDKLNVGTEKLSVSPDSISLPIVFQNDDVLVIDKPAGVLTHSKGGLNTEASVASFSAPFYKPAKGEELSNRSGIVHRLDRATSGLIIVAKNPSSYRYLQKQFSGRKVVKVYKALVTGTPVPEAAVIDAPVLRNPKKPQTFKVSPEGKPALTAYTVESKRSSKCLLVLKPLTGRTHQLRVHLNYIGHPIIGDSLYGGQKASRLMLHAQSLELNLPGGKRRTFESAAPDFYELSAG